jgi:hypothetical protein
MLAEIGIDTESHVACWAHIQNHRVCNESLSHVCVLPRTDPVKDAVRAKMIQCRLNRRRTTQFTSVRRT